jgi:hypothetical protein
MRPPLSPCQDKADCRCEAIPAFTLRVKVFAASGRKLVELRASIIVRSAPFGQKKATKLQSMKSGMERAFINLEDVMRTSVNPFGDSITVEWARLKRF